MPKLIALDLDGTLLRRDGTVAPSDLVAIDKARRNGAIVTIVTGRMYAGTIAAAQAIDVRGLLACGDGSEIVDNGRQQVVEQWPIAPAVAQQVLDSSTVASFAFGSRTIWHDAAAQPYTKYVATWSPNVTLVDNVAAAAASDHTLALLLIGGASQIAPLAAAADPHCFTVTFAVSHPAATAAGITNTEALLIRAPNRNKGTALARLCEGYGVALADCVAIGDWLNDVPMFEAAGVSFAMGGALPEVSAKATHQLSTPAGHGGGVAEAIARLAW